MSSRTLGCCRTGGERGSEACLFYVVGVWLVVFLVRALPWCTRLPGGLGVLLHITPDTRRREKLWYIRERGNGQLRS